jgi:hypothetical protein
VHAFPGAAEKEQPVHAALDVGVDQIGHAFAVEGTIVVKDRCCRRNNPLELHVRLLVLFRRVRQA